MKATYRVKDWDKHFENHESRKVKRSYWVPIPNRHDGKSYRRIASHPDGVQVFAAWILILEAASKMPERGVLADEDGPLDAEDLSSMTGFPAAIFEAAFRLLPQDRIGWLEAEEVKPRRRKSPGISRNLPASPGTPGSSAVEQNRTELQGTEGNGTGGEAPDWRPPVDCIFEFWKTEMNQPRAQLTPDRARAISERLQDSTVEEIEAAIRGCKVSDFHMGREPGKPQKLNGIEFICQKRSRLESFIAMAPSDTVRSKPPPTETTAQRLIRENCPRCFGTTTEVIPGKGGRDCDHKPRTADAGSTGNGSAPQDSEQCVSERSDRHLRAVQ